MLCPHCQKHTQGDPFSLPDADGQLTHPGCLTSAVRNGTVRPPTLAQADLDPLDALWRQLKTAVAENDLEAAHRLVHEIEQTYHPWAARLRLAIALQGGF